MARNSPFFTSPDYFCMEHTTSLFPSPYSLFPARWEIVTAASGGNRTWTWNKLHVWPENRPKPTRKCVENRPKMSRKYVETIFPFVIITTTMGVANSSMFHQRVESGNIKREIGSIGEWHEISCSLTIGRRGEGEVPSAIWKQIWTHYQTLLTPRKGSKFSWRRGEGGDEKFTEKKERCPWWGDGWANSNRRSLVAENVWSRDTWHVGRRISACAPPKI